MVKSVDSIKFRTSDDKVIECDYRTAVEFSVVKDILEGCKLEEEIEIPVIVRSKYLEKVIEYIRYHKNDLKRTEKEIDAWDKNFFKVDNETLAGIILAANYLLVVNLRDYGCQLFTNQLKGRKSKKEICKVFGLKIDQEEMEID